MATQLKICALGIDPEKDFMDDEDSNLPVPGANADMNRAALMFRRYGHMFHRIVLTIDIHQQLHISHPCFWVDREGKHPNPFTQIFHKDVKNGIWTPSISTYHDYSLAYTAALEKTGKYIHTIWKPHCIVATPGQNLQANFNEALQELVLQNKMLAHYVFKGMNPLVEHFGGLAAEVPDVWDRNTLLNKELLQIFQDSDVVIIFGEALSHCVRATVQQIVDHIGTEHIKKLVLLRDCMSCIPAVRDATGKIIVDFPGLTARWIKDMEKLGVTVSDSVVFWK